MAQSDEAEVEYCSEHLNVRKEVKIVFQGKREREIFYQSCKVHFIAFQANERSFIELLTNACTCCITRTRSIGVICFCPDKHQDPAEEKVRFKKV